MPCETSEAQPKAPRHRRDPDAVSVFGFVPPDGEPMIGDIIRAAARASGYTAAQFVSADRHAGIVRPRQAAMWLAFHLTSRSLPEIGRRFGGRDHTTVLHALSAVEGRLAARDRSAAACVTSILAVMAGMPLRQSRQPVPAYVMPPAAAPLKPEPEPDPVPAVAPAAETLPEDPPRRAYWPGSKHGSREWFAANDAVFRHGLLTAHPELVPSGREAVPA